MGYPSENHIKLNSRKTSFAHNLLPSHEIALKICTALFYDDLTTERDDMDE